MSADIHSVAASYFDYLGAELPHHCASDEFYFLPRSEQAIQHLDNLDSIEPDEISDLLTYVRTLMGSLHAMRGDDLEEEIDRVTVMQSMNRFIWEFGVSESWRTDPTLYVKIPLFACDEIMSREAQPAGQLRDALSRILCQIPGFLQLALSNLVKPPGNSLRVARDMVEDALRFFEKDVPLFIGERLHGQGDRDLLQQTRTALQSWESYGRGLEALPASVPFSLGEDRFAEILATCLCSPRSIDEVLELAEEAFVRTREEAEKLAQTIDPHRTWQELAQHDADSLEGFDGILDLYRSEVSRLRAFFLSRDILTFPDGESVSVEPTPAFLASLRATASYRAPLTGRASGRGVFHITPMKGASRLVRSHATYLSAHETYPGHHVLDAVRTRHPNPIRRQIESPLFYEGWACYGETLLDDLGYVIDPRHRIVQLQRQLWRDLRAILDVKLQTDRITIHSAMQEIQELGFSPETAQRQLRRFALTPGYQSCYFLGMYEIRRLKARYASRLGLSRFHNTLLHGGQIAFDLAEKRLQSALSAE